jgi:thiol-disulfide isomerase/thioredoxin
MRVKLLATCFGLLLLGNAVAADLVFEPPRRLPAVRDAQLAQVLAHSKSNAVIVNFWASWCEPCREEMPALQRLAERWNGHGLAVITVAVADPSGADFLREISFLLPVLQDPDQAIARAWGVHVLPTTILLDRRHRLIARGRGAIDWDSAPTEKQLRTLLHGEHHGS